MPVTYRSDLPSTAELYRFWSWVGWNQGIPWSRQPLQSSRPCFKPWLVRWIHCHVQQNNSATGTRLTKSSCLFGLRPSCQNHYLTYLNNSARLRCCQPRINLKTDARPDTYYSLPITSKNLDNTNSATRYCLVIFLHEIFWPNQIIISKP